MLKRRPQGSGAVQLGGEPRDPTKPRAILKASPLARLRLEALLFEALLFDRRARA